MIKVAVIGAAGRVGQRLVANVMAAEDMELSGALEIPGSMAIGSDAGVVAGAGKANVNITDSLAEALSGADAVINFSTSGVILVTEAAVKNNQAVVIGTTALTDEEKRRLHELSTEGGRIVFSPNMSIGVNLLFHLCKELGGILGDDYDIEVVEMHHNLKKDAPSGTAVRLAEILCEARNLSYENDVRHGREGMVGSRSKQEIGVHALRGGDVVGDHTVIFATNGERIELTHKASSRDTFAKGAVRAVRFLTTAPAGVYDMQDVLNIK